EVVGTQSIVPGKVSWSIVARNHQAKTVAPTFSRSLDGNVGIDDRAGVHGRDRGPEDVDAFEEEGSFFGEEDWKTLISCYDKLVGLNLGKIRINRQINRHPRTGEELSCRAGVKV